MWKIKKRGSLLVSIIIFISIALAGFKVLENTALVSHRIESANTFNRNVSALIEFTDDHMKNYVEDSKKYMELRSKNPERSDTFASNLKNNYGWDFKNMGKKTPKEFFTYMNEKSRYSKKIFTPSLSYDSEKGLQDNITVEVISDLPDAPDCPEEIKFKFTTMSIAKFNSTRIRKTVTSIINSFNNKRGNANCTITYEGDLTSEITIVLSYMIRNESNVDEIESIFH